MYTNFEKEKLGKTFQYYRKTKNIKWDVLKKVSTMSKTQYSDMSKGILKRDKYYDEYIKFIDLSYKPTMDLEEWLNNFLPRLNQALEYFDVLKIKELYKEFIKKLENEKNYVIYEQYYIAFNHIFKYYVNNIYLTEKEIEEDIILIKYNMFEETINIYLLEVMYISNNNSVGNIKLSNVIFDLLENIKNPICIHCKALHHKNNLQLELALDKFKELDLYWTNKNNQYRKAKSKNGLFMIYKNIDIKLAYKIIEELLNIIKINNLPNNISNSVNYNASVFYYQNKDYKKSFDLFLDCARKGNVRSLIFVGSICTHLQENLPDSFLDIDYSKSSYKLYIDYFKNKKLGKSEEELVNYILYTLVPEKLTDVNYAEPLWKIYEYEIYSIFKKQKKYSKEYIKFKEIMDKTCKY